MLESGILNNILIFVLTTLIIGNNISIVREPLKYSGVIRGIAVDLFLVISIIVGYIMEGAKLFTILYYIPVSREFFTIILMILLLNLLIFNHLKIPYSLTQGLVGGLVGVALYNLLKFNTIYIATLILIWVTYPLLNTIISKYAYIFLRKRVGNNLSLTRLLGIIFSFFIGYTFGSNTVGALLSLSGNNYTINYCMVILSTILGILFIGKRTGEVLAGKLYGLRPCMFISTAFSTSMLIEVSTQFSIPIPLSSLNTLGYLGPAYATKSRILKYDEILRIIIFWVINPILTLILTYTILYLYYLLPQIIGVY